MLDALDERERGELMGALATVRRLLGDPAAPAANGVAEIPAAADTKEIPAAAETPAAATPTPAPKGEVTLRGLQPGDLGWVVQTHGAQYAAEYGWGRDFEVLAGEVVVDFGRDRDPRVRAWIAERGRERVGCVFMVRGRDDETAKLRLLCLTPGARGAGLGARLVDEVLQHAREQGFKRVELWTHSCLVAARNIYARRGFVMTEVKPYVAEGGVELVGENWELEL
jgi:GNAT superfamily N-acetyltransferase